MFLRLIQAARHPLNDPQKAERSRKPNASAHPLDHTQWSAAVARIMSSEFLFLAAGSFLVIWIAHLF